MNHRNSVGKKQNRTFQISATSVKFVLKFSALIRKFSHWLIEREHSLPYRLCHKGSYHAYANIPTVKKFLKVKIFVSVIFHPNKILVEIQKISNRDFLNAQ